MTKVQTGEITLLVSDVVLDELRRAPQPIRDVFEGLPPMNVETIVRGPEAEALRDAYLSAKVVGPASANDALHIALATVARADLLVSWNFRHIVHFEKIRGFNGVNLREGYPPLEIRSPQEVV